MPTLVDIYDIFRKRLKQLKRKYPAVTDEVRDLVLQLQNDKRPGVKVPGTGYEVYKVRLRNPSARRGKSGGFRVIYYARLVDYVYLLTIYSKTERTDLNPREIGQLVAEAARIIEDS